MRYISCVVGDLTIESYQPLLPPSSKQLVYIAGPISAPLESMRKANVAVAETACVGLLQMGYSIYCPHTMTSGFTIYEYEAGLTYETWMEQARCVIPRCDLICMLPGWAKSRGAREEYNLAATEGHPILYARRKRRHEDED